MQLASPNILAFYLGPRAAYRDVMFSSREVFCSPDCTSEGAGGDARSIQTPVGHYDVRRVLSKLSKEQHPDILVVKGDGTLRNLPSNLGGISCKKVLVLGDTHHQRSPITSLLNYAATERFDAIVTDTNRQHVHFFRTAGFSDTYWLPNLTWTPDWHDVGDELGDDVVFVGQSGHLHPWRRAVLREAQRRGLPIRTGSLPHAEAAQVYSRAAIVLNCSLNGDLNLRTFEALAAGGLLLTDRLSPQSGLSSLFEDGRDLVTYGSVDELIDKVTYFLEHREPSLSIRRQGRLHVQTNHDPEVQRRRFLELVLDGHVDAALEVEDSRCTSGSVPVARTLPRVAAYECVQELHRNSSVVRVEHPHRTSVLLQDIEDLPRLSLKPFESSHLLEHEAPLFTANPGTPSVEHLLAVPARASIADVESLLVAFRGRHVILDGAFGALSYGETSELTALLAQWGFSLADPLAFVFQRTAPVASLERLRACSANEGALYAARAIFDESNDPDHCHAAAVVASDLGDELLRSKCLEKAVRLDRGHEKSLEALADLSPDSPCPETPRISSVTGARHRYLVVTNLFPPEELGGYGRKIYAFTRSLVARGHEVRVLAGSAAYLNRDSPSDPMLGIRVERNLRLTGKWEEGTMKVLQEREAVAAVDAHNESATVQAIKDFSPDVCLFGNIDFLGTRALSALLARDVPVLHSIGASTPGYPVQLSPHSSLYHPLPASAWVERQLRQAGYPFDEMTVAYPGAELGDFERNQAPWPRGLRIAFAGLILPFKGPHVLLQALAILRQQGVDFRCEMAGDTTSQEFVQALQQFMAGAGLTERVALRGFLDRRGLQRLFERSNVFVFPSLVPEAFGISQLEAMAAGLTIITTATGGAREVVSQDTALIVEPNNPQPLAECLRLLHEDPSACERLGERARQRASQFSVEASVDRIESVSTKLLAGRS